MHNGKVVGIVFVVGMTAAVASVSLPVLYVNDSIWLITRKSLSHCFILTHTCVTICFLFAPIIIGVHSSDFHQNRSKRNDNMKRRIEQRTIIRIERFCRAKSLWTTLTDIKLTKSFTDDNNDDDGDGRQRQKPWSYIYICMGAQIISISIDKWMTYIW